MVGALLAVGIALVASAAVVITLGGPSPDPTSGRSATSAPVTPPSSRLLPSSSPTANLAKVVVNVSLMDSGEPMGRGKGGYSASAMQVRTNQATVPHGTVTFRVTNSGVIEHEMLILPLEVPNLSVRARLAVTPRSTKLGNCTRRPIPSPRS